jgi:hypothetical protein
LLAWQSSFHEDRHRLPFSDSASVEVRTLWQYFLNLHYLTDFLFFFSATASFL